MGRRTWSFLILITSYLYFINNLACHCELLMKENRINQSTNHLYPSLNWKVRRRFFLVTYHLPIEQFVYRKKSISLTNSIDVLTKLREEIFGVECDGIVEEIPIPLQLWYFLSTFIINTGI